MSANADQQKLDQTWKYRIKRWRRGLRARISLWAAQRYGTPEAKPGSLPATPDRILVCRLNKRLGNVLFITPLLRSLAKTFPKAEIDVLVLDPVHASLLEGLPGVCHVWSLPAKPGLHLLILLRWIRSLRKRRYDLVIDPNEMSVSNRVGALLCGAQKRLGFAGEDQWLRLDFAAKRPRGEPHQAIQALRLFEQGLTGIDHQVVKQYQVAPGPEAINAGRSHWNAAFDGETPCAPVVGFFIQATGAKQLPTQWWQEWLGAVQSAPNPPRLLQLLPPGDSPALAPMLATVRVAALDELAATLANLQVFVGADSGPMHLAAAAGVPTIGLFRATNPAYYRPLGHNCITLEPADLEPGKVAKETLALLGKP